MQKIVSIQAKQTTDYSTHQVCILFSDVVLECIDAAEVPTLNGPWY